MIDSHAHLDDRRFNYDRDMLIKNLEKNGVKRVYNIGANLDSSRRTLELAKKYDNIYAVVGIHPHNAKDFNEEIEKELLEMAKHEKVVALGEMGLDFYYDNSPRDVQKEVFLKQIEMAEKVGLPIVVHTREASQQTFDILKEAIGKNNKLKVLLHCYSGSVEMMREYVKLGCYIALGGVVTFQNAKVTKRVAKEVPLERLLIETDCPYLTPEPYRGKRNEPMFLKYVVEEIAEIRGVSPEEIERATEENTLKFYSREN